MPVVEIRKDLKMLTMTVTAQFAAPVERVWAAYADRGSSKRFRARRSGRQSSSGTTSTDRRTAPSTR